MSVSFAVDDKENLQVGTEFKTLSGVDSLVQDIKTRLRLVQGEYHFDISQGLPYFEMFRTTTREGFERKIIDEILKDNRVLTAEIDKSEFLQGELNLGIIIRTKENQIIRI